MLKAIKKIVTIALLIFIYNALATPAFAEGAGVGFGEVGGGSEPSGDSSAPSGEASNLTEAGFKGRCAAMNEKGALKKYPKCATGPNKCESKNGCAPVNCLFLEEPIGGKIGYDLYTYSCGPTPKEEHCGDPVCDYELWSGGVISGNKRGPLQAILAFEEGRDHQGSIGLMYNYLQLVYNYLSGIIVAFVVFISIIGGIMITTAGSEPERATKGKEMIINAMIGMIVWFLSSLILYTINPTFFVF